MTILLKHIGRNMKENKFRSIVIVMVVLLSTAVSFLVFHLQDIITYNYDKVYNASVGEANVTMRHITADTPYLPQSLDLKNVNVEKRADIYSVTGKYESAQGVMKVMLIGMDLNAYQDMDAVSLLNAPEGFTLQQGECVISKKSADKYKLTIGDSVSVTAQNQTYSFKIAAIAESNRTFYEEKGNFQLLIPLLDANEINHTSGMVSKTRLKVVPSDTIADVVARLQSQNIGFATYEKEEFESLHYQLSSVSSVMFVVVLIVISVGAYILFALVKLIMLDRLPVIGTFRSVGASRSKVIRVLLFEFLFYGVIGTVLGLLLAVPLLPTIAELFNQYKEFGMATEVTYRLGYGVIAACIGLFLPALSAFIHIIRTSKTPLKDIILKPSSKAAQTSSKKIGIAVSVLALAFLLFFINQTDNLILGWIGLIALICGAALITSHTMTAFSAVATKCMPQGSCTIALKNLKSNKMVRSNSCMLVVIILIALMMATLTNGVQNIVAEDLSISGFDVIVTMNGERTVSAADLQKLPGVDGAYDSYETNWYGDYSIGFSRAFGVEQFSQLKQYMRGLQFSDNNLDKSLQSVKNGIIIDQYWARVQSLSVGDILPMYADEQHTSKVGDFTVAGFWDSSKGTTDRGFVAIALADYKALLSDVPERILVQTVSADQVARYISEKYIDTNIAAATFDEYLEEQLGAIDTMIGILFASVFLSGAIILCGIISNLIVSFVQRKREYAVMYSVCMSKRQLIQMLLWEMIFSSITICVVSAVSGFALSRFLTKASSGLGLVVDFPFNPVLLFAIIIFVLTIQTITTLFPILKLKKLNIVEELKYE